MIYEIRDDTTNEVLATTTDWMTATDIALTFGHCYVTATTN